MRTLSSPRVSFGGIDEVEDEADLSAVKALIALPFVEGISNLFPDEM